MPSTSTRFVHLDGLRAFLMLFGLPYHAALAFSGYEWLIVNHSATPPGLGWLITFIHLWRMPAFFVVAGFFALSVARRRGPGAWYAGRLVRLGVPCLFGLLLVNPLQLLILGALHGGSPGQVLREWLSSPDKVLHMWFLLELVVYCGVLAALLASPVRRPLGLLVGRITDRGRDSPAVLVSLLLLAAAGVVAGVHVWDGLDLTRHSLGLLSGGLVLHAPAFAVGVALAMRPEHGRAVAAPVSRPVLLVAAGCLVVVLARGSFALPGFVHGDAVDTVGGLAWAIVLFDLARRLLDRPNRWVTWLVDASLVVYIVHHPFVLLLAGTLLTTQTPPTLAFVLTTVLSLLASLACYELVNRSLLLRCVTMGRRAPAASMLDLLGDRPYRTLATVRTA